MTKFQVPSKGRALEASPLKMYGETLQCHNGSVLQSNEALLIYF